MADWNTQQTPEEPSIWDTLQTYFKRNNKQRRPQQELHRLLTLAGLSAQEEPHCQHGRTVLLASPWLSAFVWVGVFLSAPIGTVPWSALRDACVPRRFEKEEARGVSECGS